MGLDAEAKRRWEKSGMAWMKKNRQRATNFDRIPGEEVGDAKRRWEKSDRP